MLAAPKRGGFGMPGKLLSVAMLASVAALVLVPEVPAFGQSGTVCRSIFIRGQSRNYCTTLNRPQPKPAEPTLIAKPGAGTRETVTVRGTAQAAAANPAKSNSDNFCGSGYHMTANGCQLETR
jgi:hypothetical protein